MIDTNKLRQLAQGANEHSGDRAEILAEFYAATQSDTIIELLDRIEAAEEERDWHADRCEDAMSECEALRAKIEQMEKQAPAYWGPKHAIEGGGTTVIVSKFPVNPTDAPLYALPGAQTQGEEE